MSNQELIDKVIKQLKNEGLFLNLIKKAASDIEQDGFMEDLRTEGKQHSDGIFRKYFPPADETVEMTRELKEKIMRETKEFATKREIGERINKKVSEKVSYAWIHSHIAEIIEDKIREDMGLPKINRHTVKEDEIEEGYDEPVDVENSLQEESEAADEEGLSQQDSSEDVKQEESSTSPQSVVNPLESDDNNNAAMELEED